MSGQCIEKLPHSCGSRAGLQVYQQKDGTYDGYCYACDRRVADPYKNKPVGYKPTITAKSPEEIQADIEEILECPYQDLVDRKLRAKVLERFEVRVGLSPKDGTTQTMLYFPYKEGGKLKKFKAKAISTKKMWAVGSCKTPDLFGWEQAVQTGAKRLYITEGELDVLALYSIIKRHQKKEYAEFEPAVVSIPNGSGAAARDISRVLSKIRKNFKEVVLVFDMDGAGRKASEEVCKIANDFMSAELPCKDANACILEGHTKAAFAAVMFKSEKPKNTRLVWGESIHEEAKEQAEFGVSWPWAAVTELTRGVRTGETIYLGAAQKMGKSEVVNTLAAHFIKEHGWKVMLAKPEEANKKTYKLLAGKLVSKRFHDPKVEFDLEAYEKAGVIMRNKVCMINLYQHMGWDTLKLDITEAAGEGCKAFFVDPITNLTNGLNPSDANTKLQEIAQELAAMAKDLDVVIFIFCHLRNPDGGLTHDRGGAVLTSQFAGSRAMGRSCNYMFGLEGNKDPDLSSEERNMRKLILLDDREFGEVGSVDLYWDSVTTQFNEV